MDVNPNFTPNIDWLQNWQQQDLNFSFEYAYAPENNFYDENLGLSSQFVNQDSCLSTQFVTGDLNSNFSSQFSNSDWSPSSQDTNFSFDVFSNYSYTGSSMSPYSTMGQESSQMAPTPADPSVSHTTPRIESPSPSKPSFGGWTAVNGPSQSSQLRRLPASGNSFLQSPPQIKNHRKRVREIVNEPVASSRPAVPEFTRSSRVKTPSPSPTAASLPSPIAETSVQETSRTNSPRSNASPDLDRSPLSSQESVTEESEPSTPTEIEEEAVPAPKRQKTSRAPSLPAIPTTPVTAVRKRTAKPKGSAPRASTTAPRPAPRPTPARPSPVRAAPSKRGKMDNSGRYTPAELQILENAVHNYRTEHGHTQAHINALLNSNARTNDFPGGLWDAICDALPHRERHSIQKAVKRKFNPYKRGPWKPEDDEELCDLYRLYPNKWQKIGEENNRGAEASRDRWRNYCKNGDAQEKGEWPKQQEDLLAKLMRDTISLLVKERLREIKAGRPVPASFEPAELLDYGILSEQMGGTRSRLQCRNKFEKFKARDDARMEFIFKPLEALEGIAFEASSSSPTRARHASTRCATMVSKSTSRISEEGQAQENYEKMLVGDKYYILTCISRAMVKAHATDEEHIPWDDIYVADSKTDWTILDRKIVLRKTKDEYPVPEDSSCLEHVDGIIEALEADFDEDELEKHYVDRPRSTKTQRTYANKGSRARKTVSAIKISEEEDEDSPARSLPTPGSMEDDEEEEEGV